MQEKGRSIVWRAVEMVLKRYSEKGLLGASRKYRPPTEADRYPEGAIKGDFRSGDTVDSFREALRQAAFPKPPEMFPPLMQKVPQWLIDDIGADISAEIERMLDEIEGHARSQLGNSAVKRRPGWLSVLTGGDDGSGSSEADSDRTDKRPLLADPVEPHAEPKSGGDETAPSDSSGAGTVRTTTGSVLAVVSSRKSEQASAVPSEAPSPEGKTSGESEE